MAAKGHIADEKEVPLDLRTVIDSTPGLIHTSQPDGYLDFFNQTWLTYVGKPLEYLLGWKWTAVIHPDDVEGIVEKWRASLASGDPFLYEARVLRADGEYRWMLHHKVALRDQQGDIVKWYGSSIDIGDRKRAEEQLRLSTRELQRSELYLAEGQRLAHVGSWAFDPAGFDYWSPELFRIYGLDPARKAPTVQEYLDLIHPQDRESMANLIKGILAEASPFDVTKRIVRPNGEVRYIRCVGAPVVENQKLKQYVGSAIDVTEHELLTQELRRREAYLAEAQRMSHTGSWAWNAATGEPTYWSEECYRLLGYDSTQPLPPLETFFQRIQPDDHQAAIRKQFERAIRDKTDLKVDLSFVHPAKGIRNIHSVSHAVLDERGDLREIVGTVIDITERKAAEEKIREQEVELRQMLDLAPQQVAVFGPNGERLYANRVALDYVGLSLEEWRQTPGGPSRPGWFIHPDDRERAARAYSDRTRSGGSAYEMEVRVQGADGNYHWFLLRYNPLRDEHGQITRWYVASTDIDERKRAEERLQQENVALREEVDKASMFEEIVGASAALRTVLSSIAKVAATDSTVLISGETGTGKELVARAIHKRSHRSREVFVSVNCAAIPRDLIASELFGHEKGAFTGATQRRLGRFEMAEGGTIFLDEVGELPAETQIALLRVLQEREFERVGGGSPIPNDVRVIAATNRDLQAAIAAGSFRSDLFYRLNVFPIEIPPLRQRKEDIPLLVEYFVDRYARKIGKKIRHVNKKTLDLLLSYPWPGNIRELQNVVERSVIVSETETFSIDESWLSRRPTASPAKAPLDLVDKLAAQEKEMIEAALKESGGRVYGPLGAAAKLGMARSTLESKIRSLGINKNRFKSGSLL
jgi:PAS domain S-box-containing protein